MRMISYIASLTLFCLILSPVQGQERDDTAYEYEPDQGMHEEEWYDPSDWFDADILPDYEVDATSNGQGMTGGDDMYDLYDMYGEDPHDHNYWSSDWSERDRDFDYWYDDDDRYDQWLDY